MAITSPLLHRVAVYHSGRAEAVFSDGSAVILHPTPMAAVTFFSATGERQRLLSSCLPRQICGKIVAAAVIRDRFFPVPSVLSSPAKPHCRRMAIFSHVVWPSTDGAQRLEDGSFRVISLDQKAIFTLAPHGRSYVVQWWQATANQPTTGHRDWNAEMLSNEKHEDGIGEISTNSSHNDLGDNSNSARPHLGYEHVHQVQCFCVAEGFHAQLPWLYPLFLCLMLQASPGHVTNTMAANLKCLKEQLQEALATGQLLDSGKGVTAPLPTMGSRRNDCLFERSRGCDDVSPAVSMGEVSEGRVMVLWTPNSTLWLHTEGILDVQVKTSGSSSSQWLIMESSLKGLFWRRHHGPNGSAIFPEVPEILYHDMKSTANSQVLPLIDEAVAWMHHNTLAEAGEIPSSEPMDVGHAWVPEMEIGEGDVHLAIFTSSTSKHEVPHLLRLLLSDGSRLSCTLPSWPTSRSILQGQSFRLVTATGDVLRFSFNAPGPGAYAVKTMMALLHRLDEQQTLKDVTNIDAVAQGALRRSQLARAGAWRGSQQQVDDEQLTPADALKRCERTCESIGKMVG